MMTTRHPDILFITEYIKNVLYFATVRSGKVLKSTSDVHYFCTDDELVYENYYSDFGPLNLGCVYMYCKILNEKLKLYLNKQAIVYYSAIDPKKKTNAAFLLGCYGVLYLNFTPRDALKPLTLHGQSYRAFQDATQGESVYTISILDCLFAIKKARELDFFNFQDFNYQEYERLDKLQGGDLNWIVPGKFLAFIGPVDYSVALHHPPEMYIEYFKENNVKIVIRLNKRMYDANVFNNAGIIHYDLFFPDGSCPPRHILLKFLQIAEGSEGAIAVHCKAGLGRTGSLIGCYLIKHYHMTAHEAIGWMRICRPGSVIGHQQAWLEHLEPWLIKQGNLYRKRTFQDVDKFPIHEFGIYSLSEKVLRQKPVVVKTSSPSSPPMQRQTKSEITPVARPQASKLRDGQEAIEEETSTEEDSDDGDDDDDDEEVEIETTKVTANRKAGVIIHEYYDENDDEEYLAIRKMPFWKKYFCCQLCQRKCIFCLFTWSVHCAKVTPKKCQASCCCLFFDRAAPSKVAEKEQYEWRVKSKIISNSKVTIKNKDQRDVTSKAVSRRSSGAGEPRTSVHTAPRANAPRMAPVRLSKDSNNNSNDAPIPMFRTTQGPLIKSLTEAKNFLMKSSLYGQQRDKLLSQYNNALSHAITVTPHYSFRSSLAIDPLTGNPNTLNHPVNSTVYKTTTPKPTLPRRRLGLGRSPSPSPNPSPTRLMDHTRATNTIPIDKLFTKGSKATLREALSRLKFTAPVRDGSVGAASLGARRDAPAPAPAAAPRRAPSVRSDERPLATQGDLLNSIKFQKRIRETLAAERLNAMFNDKVSMASKEKPPPRADSSKFSPVAHKTFISDCKVNAPREKPSNTSKFFSPPRPSSPKGRNRTFY